MYARTILNSFCVCRSSTKICCTMQYHKQFTVSTFCNLNINLPYNTTIKPLDLFKYQNCDQVIIYCENDNIETIHSGDTINITSSNSDVSHDITCQIEAPVKANLNVSSKRNVTVSNFNGAMINLFSETGNINIKKCLGDNISVQTNTGDINAEGIIQAANILLKTKQKGNIVAGRLQGLQLLVATDDGNITTDSSYCNESTFQTKNGNLKLQNSHKNNNVSISNDGSLIMTGCDGSVNIALQNGEADIQISRIQNDSKISIKNSGTLILRLAESSQENTSIHIKSKQLTVDKNINLTKEEIDNEITLTPKDYNKDCFKILVDCQHSKVAVQTSSWSEMFKKSFQENLQNK